MNIACVILCCVLWLLGRTRRRWFRRVPSWMAAQFHGLGVEFEYYGDTVVWTWPWHRHSHGAWRRRSLGAWISLGFTGTGEWGDARYHTLADLRKAWDSYHQTERESFSSDSL